MVSKAKRRGHWTDLFRDYELKADVRLVDHEAPRVLRQILGQMLREVWGQCTPTRLPKGAPGVRMLLPQKEVAVLPCRRSGNC